MPLCNKEFSIVIKTRAYAMIRQRSNIRMIRRQEKWRKGFDPVQYCTTKDVLCLLWLSSSSSSTDKVMLLSSQIIMIVMARKCVGLQQQQQQMEYNNSTLTRSIRHQYFVKINNYIVQIFFSHYCSIQFFLIFPSSVFL